MRYNHFDMLPEEAFHKDPSGKIKLYGKGGGGSTQSTGTTYTTNIPDYAQPYVETMLGATQKQLTTMDNNGNITGFQPYKPYSTNANDYVAGPSPMQQQSYTGAANLQTPGQFGQATGLAGASGLGSLGVANQAAGLGQQATNVGIGGLGYGGQGAAYGALGAREGLQATGYGAMGAGYGAQAGQAGQNFAQQATDPNAVQAYMNPYLQQSLAPQIDAMRRQYGITGTQEQSAATGAGAFGGSREALMAAENQRAMNSAIDNTISQGYNTAFNNAQQQQQFGANLGLQGQQAAMQGANTGIAGQNAAMQGAGLGIQGAQTGLQGIGTALQGYGQGQAGLNTALSGLGQAGQAAGTLGQLGTQQLAAEQGIIGTQNQLGTQQQTQEQNKINQSIQDYATAQQYPMMQLGMMSNMLRGLPMQGVTTQSYQATPNALTQGIGALGAGMSLSNALSGSKAKGGVIKSYAKGGIASYDVGGEVKNELYDYPPEKLQEVISSSQSETVRNLARSILREKTGMAGGGIIAFATGKVVPEEDPRDSIDYAVPANLMAMPARKQAIIKSETNPSTRFSTPESEIPVGSTGKPPVEYAPRLLDYSGIAGATPPVAAKPTAPAPAQPAPMVKPAPAPAPTPRTQAPVAPTPTATPQTTAEGILSALPQQAQDYLDKKPVEEDQATIAAKLGKDREAYLGPDTATADYRKTVMEQKSNAKDEAERLQSMRLAEFFSVWGTTPGPTLVAGMEAAKKTIPSLISDKADQKKANAELDKILYGLDHATRLEKAGDWEAASKVKTEQAKAAQTWGADWMKAAESDSHNKTTLQVEQEQSASAEKIASRKNANDLTIAGMTKQNMRTEKDLQLAQNASKEVNDKADEIAKRRSLSQYKDLEAQTVILSSNNIDKNDMPYKMAIKAKDKIDALEREWATELQRTKEEAKFAWGRVKGVQSSPASENDPVGIRPPK